MPAIFGEKPPFIAVLYGRKCSGKSVLIRYVCYEYRNDFSYIVVISASNDANGYYSEFLPEKFIHTAYDPALIESIIEKQIELQKTKKSQMLLILDDILGCEGLNMGTAQSRPELMRIFTQNRHMGISLIVSTQAVKQVPRVLRNNCDRACIFRSLNQALADLYEEYSHMQKREFYDFVQKYTANHHILIFNSLEQDPSRTFACFKVPEQFLHKKFRLSY